MRKLALAICAILLLLTIIAHPILGSAKINEVRWEPVHLKVNDYYVLYAYPKTPYVDKQNRLQLPLRSVGDLLGAEVSYNSTTKTAQLSMFNRSLEVIVGSEVYYVDGQKKSMDTTPVLYENTLFIPIRVLLDSFSILGNWNQEKKQLSLTNEAFMKNKKFTYFLDLDREADLIRTTDAFEPISYKLSMSKTKGYWQGDITIQAKNVLGSDIAEGKEDLHPILIFTRSWGSHDINSSRPMVELNEIIERTFSTTPPIGENLEYILVQGRVLK
jgi:hypothetical protein